VTPSRHRFQLALAAGRGAIGLAALLAPGPMAGIMGFPPGTDTPTTRLLARLFGLREIAMSALTMRGFARDPGNRQLMLWNAAVDGSDAAVAGLALARRQGVDRAALNTLALAIPLCGAWLWLARTRRSGRPRAVGGGLPAPRVGA
jgi:hypothetical protein